MLAICQEKQQILTQQYLNKKLPHAIIFHGKEGSGTEQIANWLVNALVCQQPVNSKVLNNEQTTLQACGHCKTCLLRKANNYPDQLTLVSENKTLGVDDVRRGNSFLEKTAHLGSLKTVLIPQAHLMTTAAANALLKTLEEPSIHSYIILLTEDIEDLLPTIISRCAVYSIRPKVGQSLIQELASKGHGAETIGRQIEETASENSFVNLTQMAELTDEETYQQYQVFHKNLISFITSGQDETYLLQELIECKHGFRWLEKVVSNLLRKQYMFEHPINNEEIDNNINELSIGPEVLYMIYQAIINCNKLIKSYSQANRQFVAEQLVMSINQIVSRKS